MPRNNSVPEFATIDGERVFGHLDQAVHHARSLNDKELTKLIKAAQDRLVKEHSGDM